MPGPGKTRRQRPHGSRRDEILNNRHFKDVKRRFFHEVRPFKIVPGVQGRTEWLTARLGLRADSGALSRLRSGIRCAEEMLDPETVRSRVLDRARTSMRQTRMKPGARIRSTVAIDGAGRRVPTRAPRTRRKSGWSAIGPPEQVRGFKTGPITLFIPVDDAAAERLDLEQIVVAELSDPKSPRLIDGFSYWENEKAVVGHIPRPGVYQAFAFPRDPWIRTAFLALCRYWRWARHHPDIRGLVEKPPLRCLIDFLGELVVDRGIIVTPPIIRWCWIHRPRCSRWASLGPEPRPDFQGIGRVTQMDIHPSDGDTLIAGAASGGVWRTDNGGESWRPLMELEPTLTIGAVAIAPSNPAVMYAGSGEDGGAYGLAWSGVGIYRTVDGGEDWDLMTEVPSTAFSAIVVHPADANTIYVAGNRGLHKSRDGGQTWATNPGLASLFDGRLTDVVLAGEDPDRIYIGVWNDGVYRSTTGGEAGGGGVPFARLDGPNQLPSGALAGWSKLAIGRNGAHGSNCLVAKMAERGSRIFRTLDGGSTWTELAAEVAAVSFDTWTSVIAVDPSDEDVIYAGAATSLKRTGNGGASSGDWVSIYPGTHADQQDMCFDPGDSRRVFLANDGGVFRSTNRGSSWTFVSTRLRITQLYDIDISERDRDVCVGGAQDNGVYYRNTTGQWERIPWGDGTQTVIDPTDPRIFYFSSQNGLPDYLRRSVDGGASHQALGTAGLSGGSPWITLIRLDPRDPLVDPANNRIVFVCGHRQLFRSADGGQSWQRVEDGAGLPFEASGTISALEFAPGDAGVLYLGTDDGSVYRGVNGGGSAGDWSRIDTPGSPADALFPNVQIQALGIHAGDPNRLWVVFGGAGVSFSARPDMILNPLGISHVFKTLDAGATWSDASGRFAAMSLPDVPTSAVALDDATEQVAYCGTDVGVFRTIDGGETWQSFQDGLPRVPVTELCLNRRWNRLFAGTMGRGVWIRDV